MTLCLPDRHLERATYVYQSRSERRTIEIALVAPTHRNTMQVVGVYADNEYPLD